MSMSERGPEFDAWVRRQFSWVIFALVTLAVLLIAGIEIAAAFRLALIDGLWIGCWLSIAAFEIARSLRQVG